MGLNNGSVVVRTQSGLRTEVKANGHALVADEPASSLAPYPRPYYPTEGEVSA